MTPERTSSIDDYLRASSVPSKLADIPAPRDFKLLPRDSYSFESGAVRVAVLKYRANFTHEQVVRFYREQMPSFGWNLLNLIESDNSLLNFEREQETCIIDISPRLFGVLVTVSLGPKPSLAPKTGLSRDPSAGNSLK